MGKRKSEIITEKRSNNGDRRQDSNWDLRPETGDRRKNCGDRRQQG